MKKKKKAKKQLWNRRKEPIVGLGAQIQNARMKKGLTQEQLARKTKTLSNSVLSKIESSNITDPSISVVRDIANGLGVEIKELIKDKKK